jgi:hypothetical protein
MRNNASGSHKSTNVPNELLNKLYMQAKAQFGDAVKSYWFYDGDKCPACAQFSDGVTSVNDKKALSLNAFIYRERGVLIGYLLCGTCARRIRQDAQKNPYTQTPLHAEIERNLINAYLSFITVSGA